ncbi:MAG: hypothetical protein O3A46_08400 [Candidatus Poribacteria bacterium]|nr:hypothetical protein [Candidatus Poribacteria bacterium]
MTSAYGRVSVMRRDSTVTVKNAHLTVAYDLNTGCWSYSDANSQELIRAVGARWVQSDGKARTTYGEGVRSFRAEAVESERYGDGARTVFHHHRDGDFAGTELVIDVFSDSPFAALQLRACNEGRRPFRVERLEIIDVPKPEGGVATGGIYLDTDPTDCFLFLNSSKLLARGVQSVRKGMVFPAEPEDEPVSDGIVFNPANQRAVTFGFAEGGRWWSGAQLGYNPTGIQEEPSQHGMNVWRVYQTCDDARCGPGEAVESEWLLLNVTTPASEAQRLFAETTRGIGAAMTHEPPSVTLHVPDKDDDQPTSKRVENILNFLSNQGASIPKGAGGIAYLRLGEGWLGVTNEDRQRHFPNGIRETVNDAHAAGVKIGAEVSTFLVDDVPDRFHDALISHRNGRKTTFTSDSHEDAKAFDPSHPLTREWLVERFREVYDEWGFDALYTNLMPFRELMGQDVSRYRWHEAYMTRMELTHRAHRLLLDVKNEVAPNKTLGIADVPQNVAFAGDYRAAVGLDEYYRLHTGLWQGQWGLKELLRAHTAKWYTQGCWWQMEMGPLRFVEGRTNNESQLMLTLGILGGGHLTFTDDLAALDRDDANLLSQSLPLMGGVVRPVPMANTNVYAWTRTIETSFGNWELLALVNLSDHFEDAEIPFSDMGLSRSSDYVAYEFWDSIFFGLHQRSFAVMSLPPRSAKLFAIHEEQSHPSFISSNLHASQGEQELLTVGWDAKSESILGVCRPYDNGRGSLYFFVPEQYIPTQVSCVGAKYSYEWKSPILELHVALEDTPSPFSIRFARTSG